MKNVIVELFVDYTGWIKCWKKNAVCLMKAFMRDNITDSNDLSAESNDCKTLYSVLIFHSCNGFQWVVLL